MIIVWRFVACESPINNVLLSLFHTKGAARKPHEVITKGIGEKNTIADSRVSISKGLCLLIFRNLLDGNFPSPLTSFDGLLDCFFFHSARDKALDFCFFGDVTQTLSNEGRFRKVDRRWRQLS